MSRPKLLLRAISGSVVVLQLCSVWISNHRGPQEPSVSKSKGRAELAPTFTGPGTAGPAPHLTLQQESCAPPHIPFTWVWESCPACMGIGELALPLA